MAKSETAQMASAGMIITRSKRGIFGKLFKLVLMTTQVVCFSWLVYVIWFYQTQIDASIVAQHGEAYEATIRNAAMIAWFGINFTVWLCLTLVFGVLTALTRGKLVHQAYK